MSTLADRNRFKRRALLDEPLEPLSPDDIDPADARRLFAAIIARAFLDIDASDWQLRNSENGRSADFDPDALRAEAARWCTSMLEPWRSMRSHYCDLLGFDESMLRNAARRKLDAMKDGETTAEIVSLDTELERLIGLENDLDPATLTAMLERLAVLEKAA
jgi:hypothetical protein